MQEAESPASSHPAPVHGVSRCQHLAKALIFMGSQHKEIKASLSASRFIPLLINLILEELLEGQTPRQTQRGGNCNWEKFMLIFPSGNLGLPPPLTHFNVCYYQK